MCVRIAMSFFNWFGYLSARHLLTIHAYTLHSNDILNRISIIFLLLLLNAPRSMIFHFKCLKNNPIH